MSDDARFAPALAALRDGLAARTTPGAQLSVRWRGAAPGAWHAWDAVEGALSYEPGARAVGRDTPYDLASVTKALVGLAAARAAARGEIDLRAPLARFVPESEGHDAGRATLEALASHRAELPAWRPFYQSVAPAEAESGAARAGLVAEAARTPAEPSGGAARYSDVGYILLGEAIARAAGRPLAAWVRDEVSGPLGLAPRALHFRGVTAADRDPAVAPTEACPWRGRVVQGNVHDENAYALGGASAHAGLFGAARELAEIGAASLRALDGDASWFPPAAMRAMVAPRPGGSHRLVWDGKTPGGGSSAGARTSAATFGHLGFTGTSLWCDPHAGVAVALVTNRVHPARDNAPAIRALRVAVHDAVMAALGF